MKQGVLKINTNIGKITGTAHYKDKLLTVSVAKYGAFFQTCRKIFDEEEDNLRDIAETMAFNFYSKLNEANAPTAVQNHTPTADLIELILDENQSF